MTPISTVTNRACIFRHSSRLPRLYTRVRGSWSILPATMNPFVRKAFGGTLVLLVLAIPAFGQISTAQLSGKVTDTSNAVLPGATVTVTQAETGAVRTVVTDADGSYLISNLSPGPYRLEVDLHVLLP